MELAKNIHITKSTTMDNKVKKKKNMKNVSSLVTCSTLFHSKLIHYSENVFVSSDPPGNNLVTCS